MLKMLAYDLINCTYLMFTINSKKSFRLDEIYVFFQIFVEKNHFNIHLKNVPITISCKNHHIMNSSPICDWGKSLLIIYVYLFKTFPLEFERWTIKPNFPYVNPFSINGSFTYGQVCQRLSLVLTNGSHILFHGMYPSKINNHIRENGGKNTKTNRSTWAFSKHMHKSYTSKCVAFIFGFHFWYMGFLF
jgi:hypothetical protein